MKRYLSIIKFLVISTIILGAFWIFSVLSTGILYNEYSKLWDYRRMHPDLIPDARIVRLVAMGHETTYADIFWIQLIQFIGDNIGNGKYLDFTHTILSNITDLHPYFTRAYELDLLLSPPFPSETTESDATTRKEKIRDILTHGEKGMQVLCNQEKLQTIASLPMGNTLWNRQNLRNPCLSGMVPYYLGYLYGDTAHDGTKSEYYYKIASMQDDAPVASKFLAILAKSEEGDYFNSALSFLLVGADGYDTKPYTCRQIATDIAGHMIKKRPIDAEWIKEIGKKEGQLTDTKDPKKPESYAANNCFDSTERGIKQLYIGYISEIAERYPDISDASELVKKGILQHIPTIQSQKGFTIKKKDGIWKYQTN